MSLKPQSAPSLPPFNSSSGRSKHKVRGWRWSDWDGDQIFIGEWGGINLVTECLVQPSGAQWREIATVANHLADVVGAMEAQARAEGSMCDTELGEPIGGAA